MHRILACKRPSQMQGLHADHKSEGYEDTIRENERQPHSREIIGLTCLSFASLMIALVFVFIVYKRVLLIS